MLFAAAILGCFYLFANYGYIIPWCNENAPCFKVVVEDPDDNYYTRNWDLYDEEGTRIYDLDEDGNKVPHVPKVEENEVKVCCLMLFGCR